MREEKKGGKEVKVAQWDDSSASFGIYFTIPERALWWESRVGRLWLVFSADVGVIHDSCNSG